MESQEASLTPQQTPRGFALAIALPDLTSFPGQKAAHPGTEKAL